MSLVGGWASLLCSLLLPVVFYLKMTWREQTNLKRAAFLLLISGGLLLMCFITIENVLDILKHMAEQHASTPGLNNNGLAAANELAVLLPWPLHGWLPHRL